MGALAATDLDAGGLVGTALEVAFGGAVLAVGLGAVAFAGADFAALAAVSFTGVAFEEADDFVVVDFAIGADFAGAFAAVVLVVL